MGCRQELPRLSADQIRSIAHKMRYFIAMIRMFFARNTAVAFSDAASTASRTADPTAIAAIATEAMMLAPFASVTLYGT
jgi:hypothetical protein